MIFKEIWSIPVNLPTRRRSRAWTSDWRGFEDGIWVKEEEERTTRSSYEILRQEGRTMELRIVAWWLSTQNSSSRIFHERDRVEHLVLVQSSNNHSQKRGAYFMSWWWFDINLGKTICDVCRIQVMFVVSSSSVLSLTHSEQGRNEWINWVPVAEHACTQEKSRYLLRRRDGVPLSGPKSVSRKLTAGQPDKVREVSEFFFFLINLKINS